MAREFKLGIIVTGDGKGGVSAIRATNTELKSLQQQSTRAAQGTRSITDELKRMSNAQTLAAKSTKLISEGLAVIAAGVTFKSFIDGAIESERSVTKVNAVLKATQGVSGQTSASLQHLAGEMQNLTEYGDDTVLAAEAVLLTFDKIAGDNFPRTIKAAADLAAVMGNDLSSATFTLAKALQDPAEGLGALTKQGIRFSEGTVATIQALVDSGQAAQAQGIILQELESRVGGAATAMRDDLGGALSGVKNAFGDLLEGDQSTGSLVVSLNELEETLKRPDIKDGFTAISKAFLSIIQLGAESVGVIVEMTTAIAELTAAYTTGGAQAAQDRYIAGLSFIRGLAIGGDFLANAAGTLLGTASFTNGSALVELVDEKFRALNSTLQETTPEINKFNAANAPWANSIDGVVASLIPLQSNIEGTAGTMGIFLTAQQQGAKQAQEYSAAQAAAAKVEADRKKAIEASRQAIQSANESALQRLAGLTRENELLLAGVPAAEAAYRAQSELAGVNADTIEKIIAGTRARDATISVLQQHTQAVEDHNNALQKLADDYDSALDNITLEIAQQTRLNELLLGGLDIKTAELQLAREFDPTRSEELDAARERLDALKAGNAAIVEGRDAADRAAEDAAEAWRRTADEINRSLTDALLRGFESGKGFAENFRDTLKNMFSTLVLRPIISPLVAPASAFINASVSQGLGAFGIGAAGSAGAGAAGAGIGLGSIPTFAAAGLGNAGAYFGASASTQATLANAGYAGGAGLLAGGIGYGVGSLLEGHGVFGKGTAEKVGAGAATGAAIGGYIGTAVPVPVLGTLSGAVIGGLAGGVVGALAAGISGRWKVSSQEVGLTINNDLVDAIVETDMVKKRIGPNKRKEILDDVSDVDVMLSEAFGTIFSAVTTGAGELGLAVGQFDYYIKESIKGLEGAEIDAKIQELLGGATDALVQQVIPGVEAFQVEGETLAQTFSRVVSQTIATRDALAALGGQTRIMSGLAGIDLTQSLIAAAGGIDQLQSSLSFFYDQFYDDAEKLAQITSKTQSGFAGLTAGLLDQGLSAQLPQTRDEFRELVNSIVVVDDYTAQLYTTLLGLAPGFDAIFDASEAAKAGVVTVVDGIKSLEFNVDLQRQIDDFGLEGLAAEVRTLDRDFEELRARAIEAGDATSGPLLDSLYALKRGALEAADAARRVDFVAGVQAQITQAGLSGLDLDLFNLDLARQKMLDEATALGGDITEAIAKVEELFGIRREQIASEYAQRASEAASRASDEMARAAEEAARQASEAYERAQEMARKRADLIADLDEQIAGFGLKGFAADLNNIAKEFAQRRKEFAEAGIADVSQLDRLEQMQVGKIRTDFLTTLQDRLAGPGLEGQLKELADLEADVANLRVQAADLGLGNLLQIEQIYEQDRAAIIQKYADQAIEAERKSADERLKYLRQVQDYLDGLNVGSAGQLSAEAQYGAARDALAGTAPENFTAASQAFLDASKAYFGGGAGFAADVEYAKQLAGVALETERANIAVLEQRASTAIEAAALQAQQQITATSAIATLQQASADQALDLAQEEFALLRQQLISLDAMNDSIAGLADFVRQGPVPVIETAPVLSLVTPSYVPPADDNRSRASSSRNEQALRAENAALREEVNRLGRLVQAGMAEQIELSREANRILRDTNSELVRQKQQGVR